MTEDFDKAMDRNVDWLRVFARQAMRAPLVEEWFDLLGLKPGSRVADLGCGPGYVAMRAAIRVGREGRVYAVDRSPEAIEFLARLARDNALPQIEARTAAVEKLDALPGPVDALMLVMVLHHNTEPVALLRNAAKLAGLPCPILLVEFHPDGPCEIGPPSDARIGPEVLEAMAREAGLERRALRRQTPEHFAMLVARRA